MNIESLGNELVSCSLNCDGIVNNPKKGIIPRCLIPEKREGNNKCVVVGLNPGKCKEQETEFYLKNGINYNCIKAYFFETNLKDVPYFKRTREIITMLGYDGDILWTELVKCECSGKNGDIPIQTLRICINKFLRKEIEIFEAKVIFALGDTAFKFCALSFPNHFVVGIPHPSGSFGDFHKLKKKILNNIQKYKEEVNQSKDSSGNWKAIHLSRIE